MADTASLIARVKTEGAEQSAKQLDDFAASAGKADTSATKMASSVDKATPKLKGFGTGAQQIGYQVQDMIVQIQGGTSAFVAIGQQGSQLAGAFGPGGAVIGAIIALSAAVAGTLVKSLDSASISAEELQNSAKTLDSVLQKNKQGAYELSDSFIKLAADIGTASEAQAKFYEAQSATVTQTEGAKEAITDLVDSLNTWTNGSAIGAQRSLELSQSTSSLTGYIDDLSDKFGVTNEEATALVPLLAAVQKNATPTTIKALSDETARLNDKYNGTNAELVKFNGELFKNIGNMQAAQSQADALAGVQGKLSTATNEATRRIKEQNDAIIAQTKIQGMAEKDRFKASAELEKQAFAKREGVTKEQIAAFNKARDAEAEYESKKYQERENKKTAAAEKAAATREANAAKRAANAEASQKRQAENFLDLINRTNADEIKEINAKEQQKLDKAKEFLDKGAITQKQYEDAKTAIILEAGQARQDELDKREKKQREKDNKGDDFMAQIMGQNATELELFDIQQKQKEEIAKQYRDQGIIDEDEYQKALLAIAGNYNKKRRDEYASILGQTTDDLKTALGEGNKAYKAFAIANAIMNTYQGAVAAFQSAAAIPVVGWVAAPIAAAAAVAAGLANVAKIRSAREQGGALSAGQISTIAERGQPEVIMPAGASRVRTAQQMRQIMGENSGGKSSGNDSVVIVNQTTGRIDSAQTERDDEGRLRILIRELVSSDLQDSNSDISKSRRSTRGQPGH
ncbi:tail length tape measure protein [Enterobacter phage phiEap-2]|uniref:tail length tape measure protein n=1 Tax=Enterobacter phage phiEap-2 TaxID=1701257 RepID=UPI0006BD0401|nr:tail length tape measure protein [Enterobacter phage phiEap-2]ALA45606.1 tail length tape measure-related protein [Enterobacter phage phiEap-2]